MVAVKKQEPGPERLRLDLGAVRMWREDLAELVKILSGTVDKALTLEAGGYSLDEVDDLASLDERSVTYFSASLNDPSIRWELPRIRLYLGPKECVLEMTDPDNGMRWAASEMERIARRHRRRFVGLTGFKAGTSVGSTLVAAVAAASLNMLSGPLLFPLLAVLGVGIPSTAVLSARSPVRAILYTRTRAEAPSFWRRKRDDIWITVVSNIVSLILGAWLGYLLSPKK